MAYIGTSPSNGVRRVHTYTATANQTTFTGSSTEGVTLTYADTNYIDVFQNGVLLGSADYTSTSGTSVVLAQGASVSDLVVIVVYDVFSVADTVSKTSGGSFDSAVTMSGGLKVADGGNIGSASDADAMAISSSGVVTFSQPPVGAGGLVLLQTVTASDDATLTVGSSSLFTTTHKVYILHVINAHPVTDSQEFRCRLSKGGSIISADYEYTRWQTIHNSNPGTTRGSNSDDHVNLAESIGNANDECHNMVLTMYNPAETTFKKVVNFYSGGVDLSPNIANNTGVFAHEGNSAAIDGIQFFYASGNISTGTFKLYGVA